jgi:hypothetical protein
MVYLKCYTHLFVEDGREGEVVPTFHISNTTDLDSTSDPIPITHRDTPRSLKIKAHSNNPWQDTLADCGGTHKTFHGRTLAAGIDGP